MALVLRHLYQYYQDYYDNAQDPRTKDLFLLNPSWMPIAIIAGYLYFVQSLGPKLMMDRKPFDLRRMLLVYNLIQIVANIFVAFAGTKLMIEKRVSLLCEPIDRSTNEIALREVRLVHCYYVLKVVDLIDTIFFVLRKKQNHVSFLHVYHHTAMVLIPFFYARLYPGGHGSMLGLINTYVHAAMYFYFFLSVYRPELTKNVRWKKYITMLQMTQFVMLVFIYGLPAMFNYDCGIPRFWFWGAMLQSLFMLAMFASFYRTAYGQKKDD
ncbi:elongation of very long chain fatty acids protein AAEL008004-like [Wyeomyia smithii]|uniref:elongation of very long chain fatty acids protein AAEL008004-like n=1 Tax=Wyeomyia smithii TaxID=174621 RepID=UPI002467EB2D|nr:elongation of very long chain fatty acids protein AAEL008004-like [Wyeomyia smithii]